MTLFNICIIEDETDFRQWLEEEVNASKGFQCIGSYADPEEAVAGIPRLNPDLILVDLGLGNSNLGGVHCMLRIKMVLPEMKFMVITGHSDNERVFEALKAGANAYLLKDDIPIRLEAAITEVMEGGAPMSPQIATKAIQSFHQPPQDIENLQKLTPREAQVLEQIAQGFLNKEIADQLGISENTVKVITYSIYKKLQVNNRVEAVRKYFNC